MLTDCMLVPTVRTRLITYKIKIESPRVPRGKYLTALSWVTCVCVCIVAKVPLCSVKSTVLVSMAAETTDVVVPMSPSEKSLSGSLVSEENEKSVSRSPSTYSIREDRWPDLVVSRPRKLDAWWLPRRKYATGACHTWHALTAKFKFLKTKLFDG